MLCCYWDRWPGIESRNRSSLLRRTVRFESKCPEPKTLRHNYCQVICLSFEDSNLHFANWIKNLQWVECRSISVETLDPIESSSNWNTNLTNKIILSNSNTNRCGLRDSRQTIDSCADIDICDTYFNSNQLI